MSILTLEIKAPELAGALLKLAEALRPGTVQQPVSLLQPQLQQPIMAPTPTVALVAPIAPAPNPMPTEAPTYPPTPAAPVEPYTPVQAPSVMPPAAPVQAAPAAVPTAAAPGYTIEQLATAATPIIDAGRRQDLQALLQSFGVQALTQLPRERYGEFATGLRQLGAKI